MGPLEVDGVPAHVRYLDSLSRRKVAHLRVDPAKPLVLAVLVRSAADKLHAEADAEQKIAIVHVAIESGNPLQAAQVLHGFLEGPDAGNDDLVVVDIGSAACRERVCQHVEISVVVAELKK